MYKSKGYFILLISDHETPGKHTVLNDDDFITITGYEAYIRPNTECKSDAYGNEIHLNLFARNPDNESIFCYNQNYINIFLPRKKRSL